MKRHLPLILFVAPISFILGSWWGLYREEQKKLHHFQNNTLNIYSLKGTFSPQFFKDFEGDHQIQIHNKEFSSENSLTESSYQKSSHFDVIILPSYKAKAILETQALKNSHFQDSENFKQIHADFRGLPFDENNDVFLPLSWGINGFLAKKNVLTGENFSLKSLLSSKGTTPTHLDTSPFELLQNSEKAGLLSINWIKTEKKDLLLQSLKNLFQRIHLSQQRAETLLFNNLVAVAQLPHGRAAHFLNQHPDQFEFLIPIEKSTLWLRLFAIHKRTEHFKEAKNLASYILEKQRYQQFLNFNKEASVITFAENDLLQRLQPHYLRSLELSRIQLVTESFEGQEIWTEALKESAPSLFQPKE